MIHSAPFNSDFAKSLAGEAGFDESRIVSARELPGYQRLLKWLDAGYGGSMQYIHDRSDAYRHPHGVMQHTKSLILLLTSYNDSEPTNSTIPATTAIGKVARYATGSGDYHDILHSRMKQLIKRYKEHVPSGNFRGVVDSAPLLEREFAKEAGLGWIGKNTMLISRKWGSYFFLSAILTDLDLKPDAAFEADHCGICRACLDACPTNAFVEPHVLDATKCISYLTIEHRDAPKLSLRSKMEDWIFGCDICQEVCPWNRKALPTLSTDFKQRSEMRLLDLEEILKMNQETFRTRFRKTPLWRAKLVGLQRNALIAMTNQRSDHATDWAIKFLNHEDPNLRIIAAWSLGELQRLEASGPLRKRLVAEEVKVVRSEIEAAIERIG